MSHTGRIARSLDRLGTESAFEVLARAKALEAQGRRMIHLQIGEPDFDTPAHVIEAATRALRNGQTHYCPAPGIPELREAGADYFSRTRAITVEPSRVLVAPGAKPFLFYGILATCDPGDEVIYPSPGFPIYESVIRWAGATPVPLPLAEESGFAFTAQDVADRLTDRTRLIILNSPANPTGGVVPGNVIDELADVLADHDCWILSDEVYSEMVYAGEHHSIAARPGMLDRTILLEGFSKTFAMTGWRLGYAAVPEALVEPLTRLFINCHSCAPPATQLAGVAALTGPWDAVEAMMVEFGLRRRLVVDGLNAIPGISCIEPAGAFYAFPNITGTGLSSRELQDRLLEEAGVAMLAGTAFGSHGEGYMRVSYANSQDNLREALGIVADLLAAG